jgi:hypothetical protein
MISLLNHGLGGTQGVTEDKIRQVRVLQRYCPQKQGLFFCANAEGHTAVIFDRYSWHDGIPVYTFKWYN